MNNLKILFAALLFVVGYLPIQSEDAEPKNQYLTGNWGGARTAMIDKGVTFELVYTGDAFTNAQGGAKSGGGFLGNLDITLDLDMEKFVGWKGGQIFLYGLGNHGQDPTEFVGDAQGTSNIETGADTFILYEAYIQQSFLEDKISILFGLHDLNSEFYGNDPAGLFLNSSFGIGTDMAQSGEQGPSIFPVAALAARLKVQPADNIYILAAGYDAVAGDPTNSQGTHVDFNFDSGFLWITEAGYAKEGAAKLGVGVWGYTEEVTGIDGKPHTPLGYYVIGDIALGDVFAIFARAGFSTKNVYEVESNYAGGFTVVPAFMGRADDLLGLAFTSIKSTSANDTETSVEFTYLLQVTPWISFQPDFQYVLQPSADSTVDNAFYIGLRTSVSF